MIKTKAFVIDDLFDIHPTKSYKLSARQLKDPDGITPVLTNTATDNGIGGWSNLAPTENQMIITFSDTTTGPDTLFLQTKPFIGYAHVQGMYPKDVQAWTERAMLYFVAALKAAAGTHWSYSTKFNRRIVAQLKVLLPVTDNDQPDFAAMEQKIADLELRHIDKLKQHRQQLQQAYQQATQLDHLSDPQASYQLDAGIKWQSFQIGELFERVSLPRQKKTFQKRFDLSKTPNAEFNLPLVNSKFGNNGVMYYGRETDWASTTDAIDIIQDGATGAGMVYAQPDQTGCLYNAYLIKLKDTSLILSKEQVLFLASALRQSLYGRYNYQRKATWARVQNEQIMLPVTTDGKINFSYMQRYIAGVEARVANKALDHQDRVIAKTQELIGKDHQKK